MNKRNFILSLSLEILFTILVIYLLFYSRDKTRGYLNEIQSFSPEISKIQEDLGMSNLTSYDQSSVKSRLDSVEKTLDKALFLNQVIVPISILLLSLIFYFIIWRLTNNINFKSFFVYSLFILLLFFFTVLSFLNYLAFIYLGLGSDNLLLLIFLVILSIIAYYFYIVLLSSNKDFNDGLKLSVKKIKSLILLYILILFFNIILLSLILIIFVLSFAEYSIIIPSIILFIVLIFINLLRFYFVKKVNF